MSKLQTFWADSGLWVKLIIYFFQIVVNPNLTNAIVCTGETYEEIAKMVDDQPRNDWEPLGDMMHDYRGMLAGWPSVLQIHAVSFFLFQGKNTVWTVNKSCNGVD